MRVAIRDQLGVLVLLCTLIALAVVASASWAINFQIVSNVRTSRMSLTAALMSSQLASILTLIQVSTKALTTRVRVQEAILAYNTGSTSSDLFLLPAQDLEAALDNTGRNSLAVQCSVTAHTGTSARKSLSLLNTTGAGVNVELPSTYPNGTHVRLGDPGVGFPASLYPEIFIERDVTRTRDQILYTNSTILLGPLQINASYSLLSLTIPMLQNTNNSNILAWMTVVVDSSLVVQYLTSRQGLGETGTILIVGPDYPNNRFPGNLTDASFPVAGDENYFESAPVHFVWPVDESNYTAKRHNDSQQASFSLSQYPALINSFVSEQTGVSTVHTDLSTVNEIGKRVAIGYNLVPSTLATWVLVAELSHEEIWSPIYSLRNVLLGCIFGTAVGMLVFIWPLAHFASTPIRRLGEATRHSIQPQDTKVALATPCARLHDSALPSDPDAMPADSTGDVAGLPHEKRPFLVRLNLMNGPGKTHAHLSPSAQRWRDMEPGTRNFQVPAKVKESKHYIHDELTDLTETFNRMADELLKQYTILEERVRDRTRELEVSKHAAEAANESKTLFIANISHELKTPLNGILGMCAVCMQETDPEKIRRSLGIIYRSGDLLHNLLTDLLTFSKNEAGQRLALEEKCFKLRDISAQLKAIFDAQAEENKVEFTIGSRGSYDRWGNRVEDGNGEYGPAGIGLIRNLHLWGDYHRILQVVINLVSNSLKFTPSQGRVKVLIRCMPLESKSPQTDAGSARSSRNSDVATCKRLPPALSLPHKKRPSDAARNRAASSTRPQVQPCDESWKTRSSTDEPEGPTGPGSDATTVWFDFEVSDTGPGVPHHLQEKIFEPFVQGDLRLTKKYGGTGLGLSVSKIAEASEGSRASLTRSTDMFSAGKADERDNHASKRTWIGQQVHPTHTTPSHLRSSSSARALYFKPECRINRAATRL